MDASLSTLENECAETGRVHIADLRMSFELQYFIAFDPFTDTPPAFQPVAVPLETLGIHAELA